jgi:hypothetical protein
MGSKGTYIGEEMHVVNLLPPTTAIAGTCFDYYSDWNRNKFKYFHSL